MDPGLSFLAQEMAERAPSAAAERTPFPKDELCSAALTVKNEPVVGGSHPRRKFCLELSMEEVMV